MSLPRDRRRDRKCDPEHVFELADGGLTPDQEKELRGHLEHCSGCCALYEREVELNARLGGLEFSRPRSVCEGVAMALPTRPLKARLLWALLAVALLSAALVALALNGATPAAFVMDAMTVFWSSASVLGDVLDTVLAAVGGALLVALAVGAVLDLLLAAVLLSVVRRRTRAA